MKTKPPIAAHLRRNVQVSLYLPPKHAKAVAAKARKNGTTVSGVIESALRAYTTPAWGSAPQTLETPPGGRVKLHGYVTKALCASVLGAAEHYGASFAAVAAHAVVVYLDGK
jgi:hypothetical protein